MTNSSNRITSMRNLFKLDTKKEKVPLTITVINFAIYFVPFVILIPLLGLHTSLVNELGVNAIGGILIILFFICSLLYLIGVFTGPLVQLVLMIIAIVHKKWSLAAIHLISLIILCGGIALFIKIFGILVYAT